jgi:hypothetical protein
MISRRQVQRETEAALAHRGHQMRGVVQELVGRLGQLEDQNRELSRALGRLRSQAAAAAGDRGEGRGDGAAAAPELEAEQRIAAYECEELRGAIEAQRGAEHELRALKRRALAEVKALRRELKVQARHLIEILGPQAAPPRSVKSGRVFRRGGSAETTQGAAGGGRRGRRGGAAAAPPPPQPPPREAKRQQQGKQQARSQAAGGGAVRAGLNRAAGGAAGGLFSALDQRSAAEVERASREAGGFRLTKIQG